LTLLISWLAVDSRKPSSLYIASDSRFSWGRHEKFDQGKKIFCFNNSPDIIGYCGDVRFPTQVIKSIINLADQGAFFGDLNTPDIKFKKIKEYFKNELINHLSNSIPIDKTVKILYGTRDDDAVFHLYTLSWYKITNEWQDEKINFPNYSNTLIALGTGKDEFIAKVKTYNNSSISKTSRAVFQCLCDTIENVEDLYCGGAPQLVGLYRKWNGIPFGIISKNRRYLYGSEKFDNLDSVEWRNDEFEICDGITMKKIEKAQRQPNPILIKRQFPDRPLF
jgi:hypothetical protein